MDAPRALLILWKKWDCVLVCLRPFTIVNWPFKCFFLNSPLFQYLFHIFFKPLWIIESRERVRMPVFICCHFDTQIWKRKKTKERGRKKKKKGVTAVLAAAFFRCSDRRDGALEVESSKVGRSPPEPLHTPPPPPPPSSQQRRRPWNMNKPPVYTSCSPTCRIKIYEATSSKSTFSTDTDVTRLLGTCDGPPWNDV